ncbi:MAG: 30S ribosomal protein S8 [Candidatus Lloydbacteria bacterium]|nr:30S ribosomal protein S8 [Candidatus Lloydbacteria bacterium]
MDQIANMLTHIQNAGLVGKPSVQVSYSKLKYAIALVLAKAGYIKSAAVLGKKARKLIVIELAYIGTAPRIHGAKRVSKLSQRAYKGFRELSSVRQGYGMSVLSTPKGILSDKEARTEKVGGEVLFQIW